MKKISILLALLLAILAAPATALDYERKPDVEIMSISYLDPLKGITSPINSVHIGRGEKILVITLYNPAVREKVEYSNPYESMFFKSREEMLFTAYNVEIELIGCDEVKVKSGKIKLPALPSMQPTALQFPVEAISGEEVELKLRIRYEIIESLREISMFPSMQYPVENSTSIVYNTTTMQPTSVTNTTRFHVEIPLEKYELSYTAKEKEIPLKLFVEEKDVKIEVKEVNAEKLIAGGKGTLKVKFSNVGKKTAKNAYAVIEMPKAQAQVQAPAAQIPATAMSMFLPSMQTSMSAQMPSHSQPSYFLGDLEPGEIVTAEFYTSIEVLKGGLYPVKLKIVYSDEYGNLKESDPVSFGIEVASKPEIKVISVESNVYVNSRGEVSVVMVSDVDLEEASARIVVNSPLSALSSECYIGNVRAGEEFKAVFRLRASSEAKDVKYPAEVYVKFKVNDDFAETDAIRIGIDVKPEIEFEVIGIPEIYAGEEKILTFAVKNLGHSEARDATARIIVVSPFSSADDTAFIGNLKPGEVANASFKISVDRDATPKLYALNLEVKYRAENGEWVISKPTKAVILVKEPKLNYLVFLMAAIALILGLAYYVKKRRSR
uniref:S-layer protein n=1 Tax=Archaeoglobus fulgidus TaxID=2234 RepID=A0A7J2TJV4_ARCFL